MSWLSVASSFCCGVFGTGLILVLAWNAFSNYMTQK